MATFENLYGLYFPIVLDGGAPALPSLEDSIDSSIRTTLASPFSRRHFLYTFGSVISDLVSSPGSPHLLVLLQQYIIRAIEKWETRITLQNVEVIVNDLGDGVEVNITALIKTTQTIYNYNLQI